MYAVKSELFIIENGLSGAPGWLSRLRSDFSSGHDLMVCGFEPYAKLSALSAEPASDPLSPSRLMLSLSLSLSQKNKH